MPSSAEDRQEETSGYVEGELIMIEEEEFKGEKAIEICLAEDKEEDKGEEQDLILWEEVIKWEEEVREFTYN